MTRHIGYVLKRFPRLSETFILNELLELERRGVRITIFSLLEPPSEPLHEALERLHAQVFYLSGGSMARAWRVTTRELGERKKQSIVDFLDADASPLFAGKDAESIAALMIKATAAAAIAQAAGVEHFHAHFGSDATTVALLAARQMRCGFSYTAHARDIFHLYHTPRSDRAMRRAKLAEARFTVTVSDYNKRYLDEIARGEGRVVRLYNGIDLDRFRPCEISRCSQRFIAIGRLVTKKGTDTTLRALARPELTAAHLDIFGDGPELDKLRTLADELGIAGRVRFHGACTQGEVIEAMRSASGLVLPCRIDPSGDRDALPTVLLEALASGLPVVASDIVGIGEIVIDESTGLLVPPDDHAALATAMLRLTSEPLLAMRLAREGRRHAERLFDVRRNVEQLARLFDEACNERVEAHENSLSFG